MTTTTHEPAGLTRAQLLRRAGTAAAVVASGGLRPDYAFAGPLRFAGRSLQGDLSIVQWTHFHPAYDAWLGRWAKEWGERNDVAVEIDHVEYTRIPAIAAAEAKNRRGHDIVGFLSPSPAYEDDVIDHAEIVAEVERVVGPYGDLGRRSTYDPGTKRYFGICDGYVPAPTLWRHDLWNSIGSSPATWDTVREAAPKLKELGHPIGIGQANELDSTVALLSLMTCFGANVQDETNRLTLQSKATVEAVRYMAELYAAGEEPEVLRWKPASNNQHLLGGKGSMILNAVSAIRTAETVQLPFVDDLWLWPVPGGPMARLAMPQHTHVYSVWSFAKNRENAERFLVDLCIDYEKATTASRLFTFPGFPGSVPRERLYATAAADTHRPKGKYTILATVAGKHTTNLGHPGTMHGALEEALGRHLIPRMFAQVSQGRTTPEEAVRGTAYEMKRIWRRWRAAGKL